MSEDPTRRRSNFTERFLAKFRRKQRRKIDTFRKSENEKRPPKKDRRAPASVNTKQAEDIRAELKPEPIDKYPYYDNHL